MIKKYRFGILGCGMISTTHADAIIGMEKGELVGAFDTNPDSLNKFCRKYDIKGFSSLDEITSSDEVDIMCICLPSGLHYETAVKCIENKKHVLIEKPIALKPEDAQQIISKAEENGVFAAVVSQLRYCDSISMVKDMIEKGKFGKITIANAIMKYYRTPEYYDNSRWHGTWAMDGGGALMNQGIHGVDLLQYLMGDVVSVLAVAKTLLHNIETEDTLTAVLEYENGAIGTIQATTSVYPGYSRKIEICGTKGSIGMSEDAIEFCDVEGKDEYEISYEKTCLNTGSRPDAMDCSLHRMQLTDFVESIENNKKTMD